MRLLLIGFGHVGRELARILASPPAAFPQLSKTAFSIVGIVTRHGALAAPGGIDLARALADPASGGGFSDANPDTTRLDASTALRRLDYEVLVELTTLEIAQRGEPAAGHLAAALERGRHCVTANKGPLAFGYHRLHALAEARGARFLHEAVVMDGAPVFNLRRHCLRGAQVERLDGILNSTTNFILSRMERGGSFAEALAVAQHEGFAEADPAHDLDGWDAAAKIAVLAAAFFDAEITPAAVEREGIRHVTPTSVAAARASHERLRLVASAQRTPAGTVEASVRLRRLPEHHPFAQVDSAGSVLRITTDLMSPILIEQTDPGVSDTACGVLSDLLEIASAPGGAREGS